MFSYPGDTLDLLVTRQASEEECYKSLECFALSPPPTLSPAAAASSRAFITALAVEDGIHFSKVLYIMTLYSKSSRALTFENLCQTSFRD